MLPTARLASLDVFRGLIVALMLLVNNPGDWGHIYPPLAHAEWNGCTLADLVFPFFLFIVGVSVAYALAGARATAAGASPGAALRAVLKRAAVLAVLGLFASTWLDFDLATLRLPGVLMRIALVYGLAATLFLYSTWRGQVLALLGLLLGYAGLMQLVPVPGVGPANLGAATNLGAWLDRTLLGTAHLWKESRTWDPEGLLGTLPALGTAVLGLLAGQWLRHPGYAPAHKSSGLQAAGSVLVGLGLLWSLWFPLNKALWSPSYVLLTGGLAAALLGGLYWLCDVQGLRGWTRPWQALGVNALAAFFGSSIIARSLNRAHIGELSAKDFLYQKGIAPWFAEPKMASLAGAAACLGIWLVILMLLHRRGLVWKA
jgi:predicted acyltransferase